MQRFERGGCYNQRVIITRVEASRLIRRARIRAGLTQADLARRLGTKQPVVARWESGARCPAYDTVLRALSACGFDIDTVLTPMDPQTDAQIQRWSSLTPDQRLTLNQELLETEAWAHRARPIRKLADK